MPTEARRCAHAVVRRVVEQGAYADRAFRAEADRLDLKGRDRAFAMRLAYGVVQRRATLDHMIGALSDRPAERIDAPVLAALRLGLHQLLFMDGVADHAAVAESVDLAKEAGSRGHGFVNAVLRRATREARPVLAALGDSTPSEAAVLHSHPEWIADAWWDELGPEDAVALMRADNEPAESAARVNTLRATPHDVLAELAADGVEVRPAADLPEGIVLEDPYDLHRSDAFRRGALMPQSRASMLVARVLDPQPGERVLDLCAAPGAKTTHFAALMGDDGEVVAVELDPRRAADLRANAARLGAGSVRVVVGDATQAKYGSGYDRVLVDPPCSDLGTLQSRPDARWRKTPAQVEELRGLQQRILDVGAAAGRPGGRLVYSTCTISVPENELQTQEFLSRHADFTTCRALPAEAGVANAGGFVQTLPHRDRTDGFFIAAFQRHG
jgi:16S rRNA (cytosine967-C5)-methyltransferase